MNHPAQRSNLPWLAAVTAMLVVVLWHCVTFGLMVLRAPSDNEQILIYVTMTLRTIGEGLLVQGGLAFLIAQWRGERHQEWAYRRPLLLMAVFAGGLLAWDVLAMVLYRGMFQLLGTAMMEHGMQAGIFVSGLALAVLGVWSSWWLAVLVCRDDRIAMPPPSGQRTRAAGLAGWIQAAAVVVGVSLVYPLFNAYDAYSPVTLIATWIGAVLAGALAFGGAWLGLPRHLSLVRTGRLLSTGLLTFVCAYILTIGVGVVVMVLIFGGTGRTDNAVAITILVILGLLPLLGMLGFQWLWTRVLYAKLRRAAAA
ncbi:hypothetical protein [Dyella sp. 2RAB6]|uniref:hypothetical protein n=1 Tax=Dyella sp. 2RAB6 TaxID=3232992 RepID=UPI003F938AD9